MHKKAVVVLSFPVISTIVIENEDIPYISEKNSWVKNFKKANTLINKNSYQTRCLATKIVSEFYIKRFDIIIQFLMNKHVSTVYLHNQIEKDLNLSDHIDTHILQLMVIRNSKRLQSKLIDSGIIVNHINPSYFHYQSFFDSNSCKYIEKEYTGQLHNDLYQTNTNGIILSPLNTALNILRFSKMNTNISMINFKILMSSVNSYIPKKVFDTPHLIDKLTHLQHTKA